MYLDPQDGKEPMFKAAVRLLHNHGESLDPLQVLEVIRIPVFLLTFTLFHLGGRLLWMLNIHFIWLTNPEVEETLACNSICLVQFSVKVYQIK